MAGGMAKETVGRDLSRVVRTGCGQEGHQVEAWLGRAWPGEAPVWRLAGGAWQKGAWLKPGQGD